MTKSPKCSMCATKRMLYKSPRERKPIPCPWKQKTAGDPVARGVLAQPTDTLVSYLDFARFDFVGFGQMELEYPLLHLRADL